MTAAETLSVAAFLEGRHAQAFPSFGSERTGAPVVAFCRIADKEIRLREPVMQPDALIIQDATLLQQVDVFAGLKPDGYVLLNTNSSFEALGLGDLVARMPGGRFLTVGATALALKHVGRAVPNVPLLGAFAAVSKLISLKSVEAAIHEKFSGKIAESNIAAASEAFRIACEEMEAAHAQAN